MKESREQTDRRVWQQVRGIPAGRVSTYGRIAGLAGLPRGARRVGQALRALGDDADVPWHRVINAQGRISFPAGSAAWKEQRARLLKEGIEFQGDRVDLERYAWDGSLDALLWGPGDDSGV